MRAPTDRQVTWALTAGWAATALAPLTSAVALVRSPWTPVIDNAVIAAMTVDSLSTDPPLLGMPTSLGIQDGVPLSHPGPLGFWLLALPTRLWGEPGDGLVVGALLLTMASLATIAFLLRRRGREVLYLGANVPVERLEALVRAARPRLVVLAAQLEDTAATLQDMAAALQRAGARVGFGGRIFNLEPHLRQQVAGHFLGETVDQALPAIDALLEGPAAW